MSNAWVAVDADGSECIFREEPYRREGGVWFSSSLSNKFVELPKGSIKALIGRELSWSDEPVELKFTIGDIQKRIKNTE